MVCARDQIIRFIFWPSASHRARERLHMVNNVRLPAAPGVVKCFEGNKPDEYKYDNELIVQLVNALSVNYENDNYWCNTPYPTIANNYFFDITIRYPYHKS